MIFLPFKLSDRARDRLRSPKNDFQHTEELGICVTSENVVVAKMRSNSLQTALAQVLQLLLNSFLKKHFKYFLTTKKPPQTNKYPVLLTIRAAETKAMETRQAMPPQHATIRRKDAKWPENWERQLYHPQHWEQPGAHLCQQQVPIEPANTSPVILRYWSVTFIWSKDSRTFCSHFGLFFPFDHILPAGPRWHVRSRKESSTTSLLPN